MPDVYHQCWYVFESSVNRRSGALRSRHWYRAELLPNDTDYMGPRGSTPGQVHHRYCILGAFPCTQPPPHPDDRHTADPAQQEHPEGHGNSNPIWRVVHDHRRHACRVPFPQGCSYAGLCCIMGPEKCRSVYHHTSLRRCAGLCCFAPSCSDLIMTANRPSVRSSSSYASLSTEQ